MKKGFIKILAGVIISCSFIGNQHLVAQGFGNPSTNDTTTIRFPVQKESGNPYTEPPSSPMYLQDPSNIQESVEYNPETNTYQVSRKMGNLNYSRPVTMSVEEYADYQHKKALKEYWNQRSKGDNYDARSAFIPKITVGGEAFDKVFGTNTIDIKPQGSAELVFGFNMSRIDNPSISEKLRKTPSFTFEERIQMNVTGTIGDKMELGINYNTDATFEFENKTKLEYSGKEDEIIKKIEAGNVTLPLSGSLITGSQSLFGLKTEMQFGKLYMTTVFSQQKGETSVIEMEGGAQMNEFEVPVIDYDANKHFFVSQYFRNNYEEALSGLPIINSPITITKIEVWITNKTSDYDDARDILALTDLGEPKDPNGDPIIYNDYVYAQTSNSSRYPGNLSNILYNELTQQPGIRNKDQYKQAIKNTAIPNFAEDMEYAKVDKARLLTSREYKFHPNLGYISLNTSLNADEVLAVAYEFTFQGKTYKVGELSTDGIDNTQMLMAKLIKGVSLSPKFKPTWNLMMKNVYAIGAYQINPEDFELNILYEDDKTGTAIPYLKEGKAKNHLLLRVMNLDRVNSQGDPRPDGLFDFYEGVTVYSSNGRVFFPSVEPFGKLLYDSITGGDPDLDNIADKYVFDELYNQTQTVARQIADKNKFILQGKYKSSSSNEIMLNAMNVPRGSVTVTAGGQQLTEGQDFTVDYTLGRVKIINQGILESGMPIKVSLESQSLFNFQTKTMVGTNLNYRISDDFILGGTIIRLNERPFTKKVNIGDEPISNTIWGLNGSYNKETQLLTTLIDKLPLIEAKEPSSIRIDGEFAQLIPGQSKAIDKNGIAYIDDFEGTETSIEMKTYHSWSLASTPQKQNDLFPESSMDSLKPGYNRAKLAWYSIDQLFLRNISSTPDYMKNNPEYQRSHYVRDILDEEIFPEKDRSREESPRLNVLNLAYYPSEIGPYNFVVEDVNGDIPGLTPDGALKDPAKRWAGIQREITTNDFEEANVEFIEFWLMDPFVEDSNNTGGYLYFNLGDISEDVLRDNRQSFENGLPANDREDEVTTTPWARIPNQYVINKAFDVDATKREYQDAGLDGVRNEIEGTFYQDYVNRLNNGTYSTYLQKLRETGDFAHDDFRYYRDDEYDNNKSTILERYKQFSNPEGNSPVDDNSSTFPKVGTLTPDGEDINDDNTLNESENYYQYEIEITPEALNDPNNPYINNRRQSDEKNHLGETVKWYQFKIPVKDPNKKEVGTISGFKSIRFMRMFLKDWEDPAIMRFAKLELVRSEWRKYDLNFGEPREELSTQTGQTIFDVSSVNIEENTEKTPVSYILPPNIDRANDPTNPQIQQLNEQSIVLKVTDLEDGDARAAFKTINMDMRQYTKLKMDVHAEELPGITLDNYEVTAFIRLGSDYTNNFYEYEIPLELTPQGRYYQNGKESDATREIVWPRNNFFDIELQNFLDAKQSRNDAIRNTGEVDLTSYYKYIVESDEFQDRMITVVGNPSLSDVKVIMIGIRNPSNHGLLNGRQNDGMVKSVEVWMNELRLTNFKDDGGWAANARIQTRLSDFGSVNVAGSIITPGFGSIEKKVNERAKEEITQYDISTNLQLGKLFPEKANVNIPMYIGFSEQIINPQYNPLDEDIPLQSALNLAETKSERDSIKNIAQDRTTRKSINFTNVKVNKQSKKPMPWDPANFSVSYAYNEIEQKDIETEYDWEFNHRGSFNYLYSLRPPIVQPLKKVSFLSKPYFRIIQDFNFYYLPSRISYRTDVSRHYGEIKKRNFSFIDDPFAPPIQATSDKDFLWNWYFDFKYDLSRSLKFDYSATNMARFDEEDLLLRDQKEESEYDSLYGAWKTDLWNEVQNFGRNTNFNHRINAQYNVPINKIPLLNWTSLNTRYNATYDWVSGPQFRNIDDNGNISYDTDLGHTIKNSNTIQINNNNNLINLYNKVPYLRQVNQMSRRPASRNAPKEMKDVNFEAEGVNLFANRARSIEHRLKTEKIEVQVVDENGNTIEVESSIVDQNKIRITATEEHRDVKVLVTGKVEKKANPLVFIAENGARTLMSVKNLSISYTENNATTLPGYDKESGFSTMGNNPGWAFVGGWQSIDDIREISAQEKWYTRNTELLNAPIIWSKTQNINIRSNVEPIKGFRIDLNATWNLSNNYEEFYFYRNGNFEFQDTSMIQTGSVSISTITLKTAFNKGSDTVNYNTFKAYRQVISDRLYANFEQLNNQMGQNIVANDSLYDVFSNTEGYENGYGPTSQQVLIPAFLAAYTGTTPENIGLNTLASLKQLLPNWRITYDGLSKIEFLKQYFRSINLNHSYRSTYSVSSFRKNPNYIENANNISYARNYQGDYISEYEVSAISINEQFSPLISVDMNWKNSLTSRVELKKTRNINLSLSNNQITEMSSNETVVGLGYRFDAVKLFINQRTYESDVNFRADLSIRDNLNKIRSVALVSEDEIKDQNAAGQQVITIKFNADYVLNDRFNMRLFFDRVVNNPYVTSTFPTANTNVGFSITFTL